MPALNLPSEVIQISLIITTLHLMTDFEGDRPGFNEPATKASRNPRHMQAKQAESLAGHTAGRATLPIPGARSVRLTYHNIPVEIPPPPTMPPHEMDHAYV